MTETVHREVRIHSNLPQPIAFERHEPMLRAYFAALTGRLAWVDDIVQEVFVRAVERANRVQDATAADRFLRGIARLVIHEFVRKQVRSRVYVELTAESMASEDRDLLDYCDTREHLARLRDALSGLPLIARRMIELRYHDGFSAAAIGELLGIRATAVRVTLLRIRERLRRDMQRAKVSQ